MNEKREIDYLKSKGIENSTFVKHVCWNGNITAMFRKCHLYFYKKTQGNFP